MEDYIIVKVITTKGCFIDNSEEYELDIKHLEEIKNMLTLNQYLKRKRG